MGYPTEVDLDNDDIGATPFFTATSTTTMSSHGRMTPSKEGVGSDDADLDEGSHRRSERKRMREKQRRSDISNAFEELHLLTSQLEEQPTTIEEESSVSGDKKKRRKSSMESGDDAGGNTRLDVIGRASRLLRRLHRENEERKKIIASYEARDGAVGGHPNDNVLVMVPSLTPISDEHPVARASYPHSYPQSYHPHHPSAVSGSATQPYYLPSPSTSHDPRSTGYGPPPPPPPPHHHLHHQYHNVGYGMQQHSPPPPPPHQHSHPHHLGPPMPQPHHPRSGLSPPPPHHPQSPSGHPDR